jgi:hypothetical protein
MEKERAEAIGWLLAAVEREHPGLIEVEANRARPAHPGMADVMQDWAQRFGHFGADAPPAEAAAPERGVEFTMRVELDNDAFVDDEFEEGDVRRFDPTDLCRILGEWAVR